MCLALLDGCNREARQEERLSQPAAVEWTVLFNGEDLDGWRSYGEAAPRPAWTVSDGAIVLDADESTSSNIGGDLITVDQYENFELELEWKISAGGNSGIFFGVQEIEGLPTSGITVANAYDATFSGGALGLELDPDFADNGRLYICYLYLTDPDDEDSGLNRLSSFVINDNRLTNERILVDRVPGGDNHNGCRVIMGPDRNLYYSTGTGSRPRNAQDLTSTGGKILRIRPDGSIPPDNPFPGSPVWSYGHRNPQGLAFEPATGRLWSTEHGSNTDDELNLIEAGMNYGWPYCGGEAELGSTWGRPYRRWWQLYKKSYFVCKGEGLDELLYQPAVKSYYSHRTVAISDMVFYSGDAFPEWQARAALQSGKCHEQLRQWAKAEAVYAAALEKSPPKALAEALARRSQQALARVSTAPSKRGSLADK